MGKMKQKFIEEQEDRLFMDDNTLINIHRKTKQELNQLILELSLQRGTRISMRTLIQELLETYYENR